MFQLDKIPLTSNGKVDRKALPVPDSVMSADIRTAPRDEVEEKLAALWAEVLGIEPEKIGIDTDFFRLGGHSLKAVFLASKIQKEFNVGILLGDILKAPFIKVIAQIVRESDKTGFIELVTLKQRNFTLSLSTSTGCIYCINSIPAALLIICPCEWS